jgi:hypothetical protein
VAKIAPPSDRSTVVETAEGFLVSTPARRNWFVMLFLPLWLIGWFMGEVAVGNQLLDPGRGQHEETLFLVVWLIAWTFGGLAAIVLLLWTTVGVERVKIGGDAIIIRREVLGVGFSREYDSNHAGNLRVAPDAFSMFDPRNAFRFWGLGGGPVAFDYGSSTVRFGSGLDEAEASRVVSRVVSRFGRLTKKDA